MVCALLSRPSVHSDRHHADDIGAGLAVPSGLREQMTGFPGLVKKADFSIIKDSYVIVFKDTKLGAAAVDASAAVAIGGTNYGVAKASKRWASG